jgi:hypothetical protein
MEGNLWRRCSACKGSIEIGATYWTCNVSTCNRKRTALAFCSVSCWEVHLPVANHRKAWAVEQTAVPSEDHASSAREAERRPRRIISRPAARESSEPAPPEILIVASRLKDYVRARSDFNTSDGVLAPLSDIVRRACDEAIRNAGREGRRTVLDRDVPEG